jgi:hypothetical protein
MHAGQVCSMRRSTGLVSGQHVPAPHMCVPLVAVRRAASRTPSAKVGHAQAFGSADAWTLSCLQLDRPVRLWQLVERHLISLTDPAGHANSW